MRSKTEQLFEILTWQFLKTFLHNCPQNARGLNEDRLDPPTAISERLLEILKFLQAFKNYSFLALTTDNCLLITASSRVPPILHANHPILHGNHPILHSNHPIQRGNYPRFPAWGPLLQALCTARLPSTGSGPELAEGSSPKSVHCSLSTASEVSGLRF